MRCCGQPSCRCAQWTRTVHGKTVTKQLTADQWARYRLWFDNARQLRDLLNRLEAASLDAIDQAEGWGAKS